MRILLGVNWRVLSECCQTVPNTGAVSRQAQVWRPEEEEERQRHSQPSSHPRGVNQWLALHCPQASAAASIVLFSVVPTPANSMGCLLMMMVVLVVSQ